MGIPGYGPPWPVNAAMQPYGQQGAGLQPAKTDSTDAKTDTPADSKPKGRFEDMPEKLTAKQWKDLLMRAAFGAANPAEYAKNCAMGGLQSGMKPVKVAAPSGFNTCEYNEGD